MTTMPTITTSTLADSDGYFPSQGEFETEGRIAHIKYDQDFAHTTVVLDIDDQIFGISDLKELRKFLKLIINEFAA